MPPLAPCPSCSVPLRMPGRAGGGVATCPKCGVRVTVPGRGAANRRRRADPAGPFADAPDLPAWAVPVSVTIAVAVFTLAGAAWRFTPAREPAAPVAAVDWAAAPVVPSVAPPAVPVPRPPAPTPRVTTPVPREPDPVAPPGFVLAGSRGEGYRAFVPQPGPADGVRSNVRVQSAPPGTPVGATPDELRAGMKAAGGWVYDAKWYTLSDARPVTVGGRPGLEVRARYNTDWIARPVRRPRRSTGNPQVDRQIREQEDAADRAHQEGVARRAKDADCTVVVFAVDAGRRTVFMELTKKGEFHDDATVRTVLDSFTFLD